ncbi:serine hydrolase domain-containing protein [Arthrobacter oryzae]|uniref:serine hydrolase domain-containing protein n=1 Tax=Arthrobacter oryzae TaxID=409290 RepID=UPI002855CA0D|nr:serine hydrolase domain-containing protein [Arthrobacter oryzae]MDR6505684.1 CubicO group peptidase (beta-lactamase class C family) [Arthrobacter oryzae]
MSGLQAEPALAARLGGVLGNRHSRFAVAAVTGGNVSVAAVGVPLDADFEIGSISKGITGLLYADACERGEISAGMTLGELLPLGDCEAAQVTLASVSRHSSGLPRLPGAAHPLRRTFALLLRGTNPYGEDLAELLMQARTVRLRDPRPRYSNLGFELLGHAVAAGAGLTYRDLVATRLCTPLCLTSLYTPSAASNLGPDALTGRSRFGRPKQPWTGEALAPAGGIRASISDMGRLTRALLDGSAPGISALDPVADFAGPAVRIGAAWITLEAKGRSVTWHNGATGGFSSWLGLDRDANTGVVLMSATSASVDRHGFRLLEELTHL